MGLHALLQGYLHITAPNMSVYAKHRREISTIGTGGAVPGAKIFRMYRDLSDFSPVR
jgi:hypothetical protein